MPFQQQSQLSRSALAHAPRHLSYVPEMSIATMVCFVMVLRVATLLLVRASQEVNPLAATEFSAMDSRLATKMREAALLGLLLSATTMVMLATEWSNAVKQQELVLSRILLIVPTSLASAASRRCVNPALQPVLTMELARMAFAK